MEFTLLWAALTGVFFAWGGTRLWPEGLPDHATDRMVGAAAAGLLIGRLVAMTLQGTSPLLHPGDILIVRGGVHTAAATVGALGVYLWAVKGQIRFLDATAAAAVLGLAGWHAGCLWRNMCLGAWSSGFVVLQISMPMLNPVASAWLPVVIFLPVSAYLMQRIKT